jgi:DNA-binding beta-propeller fold protein YncE
MRAFVGAWMVGAAVVALALGLGATAAQAAPFVYVSNLSSDDISQYAAGATGALTPLSPPTVPAGHNPEEGPAISPDGRSLYVPSFREDVPIHLVRQYDIAPDGTLSPKSPPTVPAGRYGHTVAVSPDGRSVYVANEFESFLGCECDGSVRQYDVGPGGALTPKTPPAVNAGGNTFGVVVSPDGRSVYASNTRGGVSQYDLGPGGALIPKTPAEVPTASARGIAVSPDGRSVYVANYRTDFFPGGRPGSISQYDVGTDGRLTPKSPATVITGGFPQHVAVAPDGGSVYVTHTADFATDIDGRLLQFDVDAGGALSPKSPSSLPVGRRPLGLGVSADGRSVYVANSGSNDVSQFTAGPGGALSPKTPPRVAAGESPWGVATTPPLQRPVTKDDCKDGGWRRFGFPNQGQCIAFVNRGPKP